MEALLFSQNVTGVVTTSCNLMGRDGEVTSYFFCRDWRLITDKETRKGLRSDAGWHLQGMRRDGSIGLILPGCRVAGFLATTEPPPSKFLEVIE